MAPPAWDHEELRVVRDAPSGLVCVVAVHSTARGPAMGGIRRTAYPSLAAAVEDALRLSQAMTLKTAAAGLPLGGGKSVIVDGAADADPAALDAFAAVLEDLGGRYVAAEDIGTTPADMDHLAARTRWVAGRSPAHGGSGDPSPATAATVLGAMEHAVGALDGARVGIVGAGKVGARLAALLAARGAEVLVSDVDPARAAAAPGRALPTPELIAADLDVLAPCARGGLVDDLVARRLRARVVCGAANNLLAHDALADVLHARGVLLVPDFIANCGGIVQVGGEFLGWEPDEVHLALEAAVERAGAVLDEARHAGVPPLEVALRRAAERLDHLPAVA